jgi:hypothetical protein
MGRTFELLKDAGVVFVHDVAAQPWCQLTVRFLDPDGPMDVCVKRLAASGMSAEMVAESTTMPLDIVKNMLENG